MSILAENVNIKVSNTDLLKSAGFTLTSNSTAVKDFAPGYRIMVRIVDDSYIKYTIIRREIPEHPSPPIPILVFLDILQKINL